MKMYTIIFIYNAYSIIELISFFYLFMLDLSSTECKTFIYTFVFLSKSKPIKSLKEKY